MEYKDDRLTLKTALETDIGRVGILQRSRLSESPTFRRRRLEIRRHYGEMMITMTRLSCRIYE